MDWAGIFDDMASDYGYTPDQIFQLTPRQLQLMLARAGVRRHNEVHQKIALAGGKPDFIDVETERLMAKLENESNNTDEKPLGHDMISETLREKQQKGSK